MTSDIKPRVGKAMTFAQMIAGAVISVGLFSATSVQAQQQCESYTVVRGDTLSKIANRALVPGGFQILFSANSGILDDPNLVQVGQVLQIPCADGSVPAPAATSAGLTAQSPVTSTPNRPLRVITASGYAPFTDEDLEGGGGLTIMVNRAITEGNPEQDFSISFINDWGAHLESLLPSGAVDMAFPWFKPDCSKVEFLSPPSAMRCTQFNHSAPLYDALVGFYTLKESQYANATSYAQLKGATLCRPEAWFTFDLEAEQLMPPNVQLVRPVPQNGCWELLMDGLVDVVTLDALPAEEDYREMGLEAKIAVIDSLASKQTLHVFVDKDNAYANEALPIVNAGLEKLRLSGEWFNIVRSSILETVGN